MNKNRIISLILIISLLFVTLTANLQVSAVTYPLYGIINSSSGYAQIWSMAGTLGHEVAENKDKSEHLTDLPNNEKIYIFGEERDGDGDLWYKINYGENFANEGYAFSSRVILQYEYVYDEDFEKNLANFPENYHESLRNIHAAYPNWKFVSNRLDITFSEAVSAQHNSASVTSVRKYFPVEFGGYGDEWRDSRARNGDGTWIQPEQGWTYASRYAIEYFMNPANFLNINDVFMFMVQTYDQTVETADMVRSVLAGTFLEKGYDKNGDGTPEADAYLEDIIEAAKQSGVSPSVIAAMIIVEQGVEGTSPIISGTYPGYEGLYNFFNYGASGETKDLIYTSGLTYASSKQWNSRSAAIIGGAKEYSNGYLNEGQNTFFYMNFNVVNKKWWHQYAANVLDSLGKASNLKDGLLQNSNATIVFNIPVYSDWECAAPAPEPPVTLGDTNSDNAIDIVDLAAVKMHILGITGLEGIPAKAGDVNKDGAVDIVDLAAIKMHILGIQAIS